LKNTNIDYDNHQNAGQGSGGYIASEFRVHDVVTATFVHDLLKVIS
jgi:hypothetical protein